jgi:hypothetical protein
MTVAYRRVLPIIEGYDQGFVAVCDAAAGTTRVRLDCVRCGLLLDGDRITDNGAGNRGINRDGDRADD